MELPGYKFQHGLHNEKNDSRFVGREDIQKELLGYLQDDEIHSGAYLITGYRGMGKTSFVERVLTQHRKNRTKAVEIKIAFGQKNLKEIDILRQIIKGIRDSILYKPIDGRFKGKEIGKYWHTNCISYKALAFVIPLVFLINIFITFFCNQHELVCPFVPTELPKNIEDFGGIAILAIMESLVLMVLLIFIKQQKYPVVLIYDSLDSLYYRCQSEVEEEVGLHGAGEKFPFGLVNKQKRKYEAANPKEVENEIIEVLEKLKDKREFIFVFDEIDKVEPYKEVEDYSETNDETNNKYTKTQNFRERKGTVINILAGLKYLITTAHAKFIFIAGREMFDAALADISDRQSAVSSIFHQIINVDSFLKDKQSNERTTGTTSIVESYIEQIMLPNKNESSDPFLKRYYDYLVCLKLKEEITIKILYTLQNLIIYLTYRSNGSPKKLVRLIEDLISSIKVDENTPGESCYLGTKKIIVYQDNKKQYSHRYFIVLNYKNQYRLGLINYLFRPLIISFSKQQKALSDKLLVSTSFLIDHIVKFHNFAFSIQNLELVPEIISEARSPDLRYFIEDLISFLCLNHVRDTEIGLFEYKFLNKTYYEISYLCKLFEDESAAFNFTLDENYHIKTHIIDKIRHLRESHKNLGIGKEGYINSISFLNDQLGDCHFFDEEYDDAIICYSDALNLIEFDRNEFHVDNFIMRLRLKLKIGHTYEKMKNFEIALGIFVDITQTIRKFAKNKPDLNTIIAKNTLLQVVVQPYLAKLFLIEKLSVESLSFNKICEFQYDFFKVVKKFSDGIEHNIICSNYYSYTGTLFYYKNHVLNKNDDFVNQIQIENSRNSEVKVKGKNEILIDNYAKCIENYINEFNRLIGEKEIMTVRHNNSFLVTDYRVSSISYANYKLSLVTLIKKHYSDVLYDIDLISLLKKIKQIIGTDYANSSYLNSNLYDKTYYKNIAINLFKLGDLLYSCIVESNFTILNELISHGLFYDVPDGVSAYWNFDNFDFDVLESLLAYMPKDSLKLYIKNEYIAQLVICIYFWSAQYYLRIGKNMAASFQYRKIMETTKNLFSPETINKFDTLMEKFFFSKIVNMISWNSNSSDRYQIYKQKIYTKNSNDYHTKTNYSKYLYLNASTNPEVMETVLLLVSLKQRGNNGDLIDDKGFKLKGIDLQNLVSPYSSISSQFVRIKQLHLQHRLNKQEFKNSFPKLLTFLEITWNKDFWINDVIGKTLKTNEEVEFNKLELIRKIEAGGYLSSLGSEGYKYDKDKLKILINIISSSIYCLNQITSIINVYGVGYYMSYTDLADTHRRLGKWLKYYEFVRIIFDGIKEIKDIIDKDLKKELRINEILEDLMGIDVIHTIDTASQFQLALQNYHRGKQLHQEGSIYKKNILNMYYLEDDFSDSLYHYCIARERQKINSGLVRKHIEELNYEIRRAQLYSFGSYVNSHSL